MPKIRTRILFATDLSQHSTYALKHAVGLAKVTGAEIHIIHASEPLSDDAKVTMMMFMQDEKTRRNALTQRVSMAEATLKERQDNFWGSLSEEDQKMRAQVKSCEVILGHPAEVVLREADARNCDLIVLGAHEHGFGHTFLGTEAKRILRRATIPTLVVPYKDD